MNGEADHISMLRENVKEFVKREVMPIASSIDEEDRFPEEVFRSLGKQGYLGITVPEKYGGSGLDYDAQAVIQEELGYASASLALSYGAHSNLVADSVYRNGSEYIRETFLKKLCTGEWIGSLCLTEPSSGSDALAMKTEARKTGDYYVINGSKTLITNAPYADLLLVYAKTGDAYTAFIVLGTDSGVSRGKKFSKMGMRGSPTGELFFEDVKVPENRILGKVSDAKNIILSGLNAERVILSFIFLGITRRAMELSVKYASERKQFGEPISEFELIQEKLAYMYTKYKTSKLLCNLALNEIMKDRMSVLDAAASIMYAAETSEFAAREAIQIHGGVGYIKEGEVERLLRDAILGQIGAGTTEIRKKLVASNLIKFYTQNKRIPE